jgi:hypothetical protein
MRRLNVRRGYLIGVAIAVVALGAVTVSLQRARAAGIPATGAMIYSGLLQDATGAPLGNPHTIEVKLWASASPAETSALCDTGSPTGPTPLTAGRFSIQLPDPCTMKIAGNNNAFAEVILDGVSLGRVALGAVPYAVEANHAVSADSATTAGTASAAAGTLAQQVVPAGAVVAFNLSSCPTGWTAVTSAQGRVVVGVNPTAANGVSSRVLGATLGEETHTMTIGEMPAHNHVQGNQDAFTSTPGVVSGSTPSNSYRIGNFADPDAYQQPSTSSTGGGQPFNNMQPSVVFLYCQKS